MFPDPLFPFSSLAPVSWGTTGRGEWRAGLAADGGDHGARGG